MISEAAKYGLVFVTAANREEAEAIAQILIAEKLAACVTIAPVYSMYRWQGDIQREDEWQLTIKTTLQLFTMLSTRVQAIHSYEVPEIIAIPLVAGEPTYLNWLAENTPSINVESKF